MARKAIIKAITTYLPAITLTNEQLAEEFQDWDVEKIYQKTGIAVRHIAGDEETAADLGVAAAQRLFEQGQFLPTDIDFLLFCTQSPDQYLPTTACTMQARLGLPTTCGALDFNLGCSGYIYGLSLAKGLIETGVAHNVLLITAETYSKYIHPEDRSVRTIFGDGAAATLISMIDTDENKIGPFIFGTDGTGAEHLRVNDGGHRAYWPNEDSALRTLDNGVVISDKFLYMSGADIYNFTLVTIPNLLSQLLDKCGFSVDDVDYFIFHQANKFMLERLMKKTHIPAGKFCINMENYGNTVSSTIPMALEILLARGAIKSGDKVILVGFGVGLSWGATLITIN